MSARLRSKLSQAFNATDRCQRPQTPLPNRQQENSTEDSRHHWIDESPTFESPTKNGTSSNTMRRFSKTLRAKASAILRSTESSPGQGIKRKNSKHDLQDGLFSSLRKRSSAALLQRFDQDSTCHVPQPSSEFNSPEIRANNLHPSTRHPKISLDISTSPLLESKKYDWYRGSEFDGSELSLISAREVDLKLKETTSVALHVSKNKLETADSEADLEAARNRFYTTMWHSHKAKPEVNLLEQIETELQSNTKKARMEDVPTDSDSESDVELALRPLSSRLRIRNANSTPAFGGTSSLSYLRHGDTLTEYGARLLIEAIDKPAGYELDYEELAKHKLMVRVVRQGMCRYHERRIQRQEHECCMATKRLDDSPEGDDGSSLGRTERTHTSSHQQESSMSSLGPDEMVKVEDARSDVSSLHEFEMDKVTVTTVTETSPVYLESDSSTTPESIERPRMSFLDWKKLVADFRRVQRSTDASLDTDDESCAFSSGISRTTGIAIDSSGRSSMEVCTQAPTMPQIDGPKSKACSKIPRPNQTLRHKYGQVHPVRQPHGPPSSPITWTPTKSNRWA